MVLIKTCNIVNNDVSHSITEIILKRVKLLFLMYENTFFPNIHRCLQETSSRTVLLLKEEWTAAAVELTVHHDCDAVTQEVSLVHEVSGQHHGATHTVVLQDVPRLTTSVGVHA